MIAALVLFPVDGALSHEEAAARFASTAPNYEGLAGLHSKAYVYEDGGANVGGFYVWESREAAEAMYTDAWREKVSGVYGVSPSLRYFDVPVYIDNTKTASVGV